MSGRLFIFTVGLIAIESYQFYIILTSGTITGDFFTELNGDRYAYIGYVISVFTWVFYYALVKLSCKGLQRHGKGHLSVGLGVLLLFGFNLLLTIFGGVGSIEVTQKSKLSILATLIPIQYLLIYILSQERQRGDSLMIIYAAVMIYVFNDIYRMLIGAVYVTGFVLLMKSSKKMITFGILLIPVFYVLSSELLAYKLSSRGYEANIINDYVLDQITSRISITPVLTQGIQNINSLSSLCHSEHYANQFYAALMTIVPKSIFGIGNIATYNNCVIDEFLGYPVDITTVNSPFILNLMLATNYSLIYGVSYLFLVAALIMLTQRFATILLGGSRVLFLSWLFYDFIWTGNIARLTIPLWFMVVIYSYIRFRNAFNRTNPKVGEVVYKI